ncbi:hypothetical protein EVAR_4860_1 [Eumeta japonica]|uniref:Uncharacterized protein n=1 Tax=Eumeta variegata TaxID=151549 RepID=A0A4C1T231_EUMVA|nr:hypothetical protein EVAR_4860_1 [Eumeta japonica]
MGWLDLQDTKLSQRPIPLSSPQSPSITLSPSISSSLIRYLSPIQKDSNAHVTPLELRVSMGVGSHPLCGGSCARLFL